MLRKLVLGLCAAFAATAGASAAPLEAYGKLPSIESVAISPGGAYVAYVITNGEKRSIAVQSTADHKMHAIAPVGMQKVRDVRWAGDDHLLITTSTSQQPVNLPGQTWLVGPKAEFWIAQDLNLKTGHAGALLSNIQSGAEVRNQIDAMNTVLSLPVVRIINGKPAAFVRGRYFDHNKGSLGLFRVDLDGDKAYLVDRGVHEAYDWVVDPDGRLVAEAAYNDEAGVWTLMIRGSDAWRPVQTFNAPIDTPDLVGLGRDGKSVLVQTADGSDGATWRELSLDSGAWGETLPIGGDMIHDPVSGRLIGESALIGDRWSYTFFDPHDAAVWRAVIAAFPGDIVRLQSWSSDRKKIVVRVDSAELGPAFALVDLTTHQVDWLGSPYDLKAEDVSPVKAVRYRAADGLQITGYLTLPRGRDPHGLPLVVLAHGGPAARDEPGFDWWAQALASRGYAVLQANYRGSDGFGRDFLAAGFGEWGRKMQTDLSDGVRELVRQGVADPRRVCIAGASYGGYAALAGATIDHGVYRCAVSVGGVADLAALAADRGYMEGRAAERYWFRFIGARAPNDAVLTKYSPLARAADADIPVLLIHGRDDTVVPIGQSRRMAAALRNAGKPVELVELEGEDHWLSRGETRLQMLQTSVAFLEKNNPPN